MRTKRRKTGRGFTLVEMLVVVAILTVMLGILLPAVTRARAHAARATCINHLHEVGGAIEQVAQKNGGLMPTARSLAPPILNTDRNPPLTVALIGQLHATTGVFQCPGDVSYLFQVCGISYYYHFALSNQSMEMLRGGYMRWDNPSDMPILWDADNTVLQTTKGELTVPRFHEVRMSLYMDMHVAELTDADTPFF